VVATYNAGTPFDIPARSVQDPNTGYNLDHHAARGNRGAGSLTANRKHEYKILPVLGLNCWEHAYITDYGVNGKSQYLKNWWAAINWKRVFDAVVTKTQVNAARRL
jgi:superoxide dismutase, Fe-Mn family